MATFESDERMASRRHQGWREQGRADPAVQALRRQIAAQQRYRIQHPFSGLSPDLLRMHCIAAGPLARRATASRTALQEATREQILLELAIDGHVVYPQTVSTDVDDLRFLAEWHEVKRKLFSSQ